ncbi:hypothetical protein GCM10009765_63170 [Fodinicola feengrottensis]|uniref:Transposase n=1 Tax=Fodinicola feengrottensis TaxID=435914 RepID=A0ABN2IHR6_9ACTN
MPWRGGLTTKIHALADKAYSHPSTRQQLRDLKIPHTIPERSEHIQDRETQRLTRWPTASFRP